jgi:hypothetical protein
MVQFNSQPRELINGSKSPNLNQVSYLLAEVRRRSNLTSEGIADRLKPHMRYKLNGDIIKRAESGGLTEDRIGAILQAICIEFPEVANKKIEKPKYLRLGYYYKILEKSRRFILLFLITFISVFVYINAEQKDLVTDLFSIIGSLAGLFGILYVIYDRSRQ